MYQIKQTDFGVHIVFEGSLTEDHLSAWIEESKLICKKVNRHFGVLVDMRSLNPLTPASQRLMQQGQRLFKDAGMARSCVILSSALLTIQFRRIAKETGIYQWERYLDASKNADWQTTAEKWLAKGIDPDSVAA